MHPFAWLVKCLSGHNYFGLGLKKSFPSCISLSVAANERFSLRRRRICENFHLRHSFSMKKSFCTRWAPLLCVCTRSLCSAVPFLLILTALLNGMWSILTKFLRFWLIRSTHSRYLAFRAFHPRYSNAKARAHCLINCYQNFDSPLRGIQA